jgi:gliding motility-associated-like protein
MQQNKKIRTTILFTFIYISFCKLIFAHGIEEKSNSESIKSLNPKVNNYTKFTPVKRVSSNEWQNQNSQEFFKHPEYGTLPFNAPEGIWVEQFEKRKENYRYFINPEKPSEFSIQKSLGDIHFFKDGFWQTINPQIKNSGNGILVADMQPEPVGFNVDLKKSFIKTFGGEIEFNSWKLLGKKNNLETELSDANWTDFTAGDDGIYIKNIFPGIDAEMNARQGSVKTNFIIKKLLFEEFDYLIFKDSFYTPLGTCAINFKDESITGNTGSDDLLLKFNGQEYLEISKAVAYPKGSFEENSFFPLYTIFQNNVEINIPIAYIKQHIQTDDIIIDPLVTTTGTLGTGAITGSMYNASCNFINSCNHNLSVTPPASATITNAISNFNYQTAGACLMNAGAITFGLNSCVSPQTGFVWTCNNPTPGTCTGTNTPLFPEFAPCMPAPSCNPVPLNFVLRFYRRCVGTAGCNNTCIRAGSPWVITIQGQTLNVGSASASGGTSNICAGASANLVSTGSNGTPPYSFIWNPGALVGQNQTVTPASSAVYNVLITDACGSTATQNVTVNVTPNTNPNFTISPNPACVGDAITFTGLGTGNANSYDWLLPSSSTATQNNLQTVSGITYANAGTYNATLNYQQGLCVFPITSQITINDIPAPPIISTNSPVCLGQTLSLEGPSIAGANYTWTGPGFTSSLEDPVINNTTNANAGNYNLTVTVNGCTSNASNLSVAINPSPAQPTITSNGSLSICNGQSLLLTSSAANSYLWSNGATTQSITVSAAGSYSVQVFNAQGCSSILSNAAVVALNPNPSQPTVSAGGPTTFCNGNNVTLNSSAGNSYLWSNGETTQSITVTNAGTYSVVVTNNFGCSSISSVSTNVVVNPGPGVPAITGGPLSFCAGGSVTLSAPAGFSYLWSNGSTNQTVTLSNSQSISVSIADANGCNVSSVPTNVVVNPLPTTPIITANGPTTFCQGNNVVLSAPNGFSYSWSNGATTQTINVNSSGNYTVSITDANNCTSLVSSGMNVNVNNLPLAPTISSSGGSTTACQGQTITLIANGGLNYLWSTSQTSNSIVVNTSGNYTVTSTDANGCTSLPSAAIGITIFTNPPVPTTTTSGSTTLCAGQNVTITAQTSTSYLWSNGSTNQSITVGTAGNYTVSIVDLNGCTSQNSLAVVVIVNPNPTAVINANGPTSFCNGGSVQLNSVNTFNSYLWSNGATTQSISTNVSGNYTLQVSDANGCISSSSNSILINVFATPALPVINSSSNSICAGSSITLSSSNSASYLWSNGSTTQNLTTSIPGNYSVIVTDINGCTSASSAVFNLVENPLPNTPSISSSGVLNFCEGGSVTLSGPPGFQNYVWNSVVTTNQNNVVSSSGTYTLQVTDANGCSSLASAPVDVTVYPNPSTPNIIANGPISFCDGGNVELSVVDNNVSYLWSNGATTQSIVVDASGNFTVEITNQEGCVSGASANTSVVEFPVPPIPVVTSLGSSSVCEGSTTSLVSTSAASYLWQPNGETTQSIEVGQAGNYSVSIIDLNGCPSGVSNPLTITLLPLPPSPQISANGLTTFCFGNSVELSSNSATNNNWNSGETTQNITVTNSGEFFVTVLGVNGCFSLPSNSIGVIVNSPPPPPVIVASGPLTFCSGDAVVLSVTNSQSYLWNNGSTASSQEFNQTESITVNVLDVCGVPYTLQAQVTVLQQPTVMFDAVDTIGCIPLQTSFLNLSSNYNEVFWDFGDGNSSVDVNPVHKYMNAGKFTVSLVAISQEGCLGRYSKNLFVEALSVPKADFKTNPEFKIKISKPDVEFIDLSSGSVTQWNWSIANELFSELKNPIHKFADTGIYKVKLWIKNIEGCQDTISKNIIVNGDLIIYIPNTFSPNNDGVNEVFLPIGTYVNPKEYNLKIFDRWGQMVYETNDLYKGWDGDTGTGAIKQTQTYFWQIRLKDFADEEHNLNGRITLIY